MDALGELTDASRLPFFNSNQMLSLGHEFPGGVSRPITDSDAHATFWIACLASEQQKYRSLYSAIRGACCGDRNKSKNKCPLEPAAQAAGPQGQFILDSLLVLPIQSDRCPHRF